MTLLAVLALAPGAVDYQTLAKPLPEVLADLGPMLRKRVVYDELLAEDRVVVNVTAVDPRELLQKVAQAVSAVVTEDEGTLRLSADHGYEARLLQQRREGFARINEGWKKELEKPVRAGEAQLDMTSLGRFLTPALLESVKLYDNVVYERPARTGAKSLPPWVLPFEGKSVYGNRPTTAVRVTLSSSVSSFGVTVHVATEDNELPVYTRSFGLVGDPAVLRQSFEVSPELARLTTAALGLRRGYGEAASATDVFDAFKGRPWGDEPLNAVTVPFLMEATTKLGTDFVACLSDEAGLSQFGGGQNTLRPYLYYFHVSRSEGDWLVVTPANPRLAREQRVNRVRMREYLEGVRVRGWVEFWEYAKYRSEPRSLPWTSLALEAASIGPLAHATLMSFSGEASAAMFLEAQKDPALAASLSGTSPVGIERLPRGLLGSLESSLRGMSRVQVTTSTARREGRNVFTSSETRVVRPSTLGLERGLPRGTQVTIAKYAQPTVVALHNSRKYMIVASLGTLARAIVYSEAGRGDEQMHAMYAAEGYVPANSVTAEFRLLLPDGRQLGSVGSVRYMELPHGTSAVKLDDLPGEHKKAYERELAEARRRLGGG